MIRARCRYTERKTKQHATCLQNDQLEAPLLNPEGLDSNNKSIDVDPFEILSCLFRLHTSHALLVYSAYAR